MGGTRLFTHQLLLCLGLANNCLFVGAKFCFWSGWTDRLGGVNGMEVVGVLDAWRDACLLWLRTRFAAVDMPPVGPATLPAGLLQQERGSGPPPPALYLPCSLLGDRIVQINDL